MPACPDRSCQGEGITTQIGVRFPDPSEQRSQTKNAREGITTRYSSRTPLLKPYSLPNKKFPRGHYDRFADIVSVVSAIPPKQKMPARALRPISFPLRTITQESDSQTKNAREGITTLLHQPHLALNLKLFLPNKKCPPVLTALVRARALRLCAYSARVKTKLAPKQKMPTCPDCSHQGRGHYQIVRRTKLLGEFR
jgi:hypothetical protein